MSLFLQACTADNGEMGAGASARQRSVELHKEAEALAALARSKEREARNYQVACVSEQRLADVLRGLDALQWRVFADRVWPGSSRANIDFVLVGPGGIVVLDAKDWSEPHIEGGTLFRGQAEAGDQVDKLIALQDRLATLLAPQGIAGTAICVSMVFTSQPLRPTALGPVTAVGDRHVLDWLLRLPLRLNPQQIHHVSGVVAEVCPEMRTADDAKFQPAPRRNVPQQQERIVSEPLFDVAEVKQALIDRAMAGPIEEWMTFLHPDQNKLVRAQFSGPARVRGPAGTGKTVVGLHRAVYLAERSPQPVLVVSFVKTLPRVLEGLTRRLSPTGADNIEFIGVHALARRCLEVVGGHSRLDPKAADAAYSRAWWATDSNKRLGQIDDRPSYWREEVDHVIKGRGLTDFETYRTLRRIGRNTRLRAEDREKVWDLYIAYQRELDCTGVHDFNDLLIQARRAVVSCPELFCYRSVIVDEIQDLDLVALQFLARLAGDGPDSLLLIGDGQQSVYPGGFTLTEAGISVAGRASILKVNYRNTIEILAEANRQLGDDPFDDFDGEAVTGLRDTEIERHGYAVARELGSRSDIAAALVSQIRRTHDNLGVPWGDMAVLTLTLKALEWYQGVLCQGEIPEVELTQYDGVSNDRVKIGTVKRAKGLDFKFVFMPELHEGPPPVWSGENEDAYAERCRRTARELFVGMTRARDGLWLGYVASARARGSLS